jgi:tRNA(Ile)-lysidine synthase TilS/MesJ
MTNPAICARCVLPATFPNITFDRGGVCCFCNGPEAARQSDFDARQRHEFERIVAQLKGRFIYDALCCYSGGKDSTFLLKMMVRDLDLSVLAFTLDNGFITAQSKQNIVQVVDLLGVDHLFFKPARCFMTRMYREAVFGDLNRIRGNYITRISDVCLSCISVVNAVAARLALQHRIPMIFAGFTPGQIPRAVIRNNHRFYRETFAQHGEHLRQRLGARAAQYLDLPEDSFEIYQMSPYLVYEKSEEVILAEIRKLGWVHPERLDGCTSNCALNAVGNLCHEKKHGFHPYVLELSKLVRKGLLSRDDALAKLAQTGDEGSMVQTLVQLGIRCDEIEALRRRAWHHDIRSWGPAKMT